MRYVKLENGNPVNYTIEQLFIDYPNAEIYKYTMLPNESLLANYNVYPLITTQQPMGDVVEEDLPEFKEGEWYQTWKIRDFSTEELLEKKAEMEISIQQRLEDETTFFVATEISQERYSICQSCDRFNSFTTQCKECGCIMYLKSKLRGHVCPMNKWG